jgi:hypothetical protein
VNKNIKADDSVVVPLILAAKDNASIRDYREITAYLRSLKPAEGGIKQLGALLKEPAWETRMLAMSALSVLSGKAAFAMPEMARTLDDFGADAGRFSQTFDFMAMINPEIAAAAVIRDINSSDRSIRKNALEKLLELQVYLAGDLSIKKEITRALIRALYSPDNELSKEARGGLMNSDDPEAKQEVEAYVKMGGMAVKMIARSAGKSPEEMFKEQELAVEKQINDYYRSVGREDAVK